MKRRGELCEPGAQNSDPEGFCKSLSNLQSKIEALASKSRLSERSVTRMFMRCLLAQAAAPAPAMITYAQNFEDVLLARVLRNKPNGACADPSIVPVLASRLSSNA